MFTYLFSIFSTYCNIQYTRGYRILKAYKINYWSTFENWKINTLCTCMYIRICAYYMKVLIFFCKVCTNKLMCQKELLLQNLYNEIITLLYRRIINFRIRLYKLYFKNKYYRNNDCIYI